MCFCACEDPRVLTSSAPVQRGFSESSAFQELASGVADAGLNFFVAYSPPVARFVLSVAIVLQGVRLRIVLSVAIVHG